MGTRERRRREFFEREQRILDSAQALIRTEGLLHLQMSRVAEASEYAVGTLYQHFAKKEDLLVALCARQMRARVESIERFAASWPGPSRERLLAVVIVELDTLERCPDVFRLEQFVFTEVVWAAASPERRQECLDAGEPMARIVTAIVNDARAAGDLPADVEMSALETTIGPWSLCVGMLNLTHATGLFERYAIEQPQVLLFMHLNHLLNGHGWQPLLPRVDQASIQAQMQRLRGNLPERRADDGLHLPDCAAFPA